MTTPEIDRRQSEQMNEWIRNAARVVPPGAAPRPGGLGAIG